MANERLHQDIEHRIVKLERYVTDQTVRSADFGKRFASLERAVAAMIMTVTEIDKRTLK